MKPVSPVLRGSEPYEVVYAKDQPQYNPLPTIRSSEGIVLSRWKLTWKERFKVLLRGNVYLFQMTFNRALQPVSIEIEPPKDTQEAIDAANATATASLQVN